MCIRLQTVHTPSLKIRQSVLDFGGLWKHEREREREGGRGEREREREREREQIHRKLEASRPSCFRFFLVKYDLEDSMSIISDRLQ